MTLSQTYRGALTAGFLLTAVFHMGAAAQSNFPQGVRNVVIVHGAWADGSSWSKVIPLLQAKGLHVVAIQNPLTSLADDVAATRRAIARWEHFWLAAGYVIFFVIHFLQVAKAGWNNFRAMVTGYEIATISQSSSEKPNPSVLAKGTL